MQSLEYKDPRRKPAVLLTPAQSFSNAIVVGRVWLSHTLERSASNTWVHDNQKACKHKTQLGAIDSAW